MIRSVVVVVVVTIAPFAALCFMPTKEPALEKLVRIVKVFPNHTNCAGASTSIVHETCSSDGQTDQRFCISAVMGLTNRSKLQKKGTYLMHEQGTLEQLMSVIFIVRQSGKMVFDWGYAKYCTSKMIS